MKTKLSSRMEEFDSFIARRSSSLTCPQCFDCTQHPDCQHPACGKLGSTCCGIHSDLSTKKRKFGLGTATPNRSPRQRP